jgi:hypothetical protein
MKNKARPGLKQLPYGTCICIRTQRVDWDTLFDPFDHIALGQEFTQMTPANGVHGTLIEGNLTSPGYGIFKFADCSTHFVQAETGNTVIVGPRRDGGNIPTTIAEARPGGVRDPIDTQSCRSCCPPVATWKEVNNPKGNQAMSAYIARKKQITHNCIRHCIPGRGHYNEASILVVGDGIADPDSGSGLTPVTGTYPYGITNARSGPGPDPRDDAPPTNASGKRLVPDGAHAPMWSAAIAALPGQGRWGYIYYNHNPTIDRWVLTVQKRAGSHNEVSAIAFTASSDYGDGTPPETGWIAVGLPISAGSITLDKTYIEGGCAPGPPCDNVGCKCNCSKGMGGVSCCNVHKTMLPLSNSENIPWVIKQRACFNKKDYFKGPRNPNTC